jgi:GNAT superfamily N-acetyltransferase
MWTATVTGMTTIRPARPEEASALTALCIRSKAHWGYDAVFMRQAEAALTISNAMIEAGRVLVAESEDGRILGVAAVEKVGGAGQFDLALIFVEPPAICAGIGRSLFAAAVRIAAVEGGKCLSILADPFAEAFYKKLGAVRIGEAPSDAIPGRRLPLLEYRIDKPCP